MSTAALQAVTTSQQVRAAGFTTARRGYDPAEVGVFLDAVHAGLDLLNTELRQARERVTRLERELAEARGRAASPAGSPGQARASAPEACPP